MLFYTALLDVVMVVLVVVIDGGGVVVVVDLGLGDVVPMVAVYLESV